MRLPLTSPAARLLLVTLALGASAAVAPAPATAAFVLEGNDVAPVVVSVGDTSAAKWIPSKRRRAAAPVRTGTSSVAQVSNVAPVAAAPAAPAAVNQDPAHAASYSYMAEEAPGTPIRWNPCGAISWVFNPANAPAGGLETVQSAIARISSATGLRFEYAGTTGSTPTSAYIETQSATGNFAPLLVGWTTPTASTLLANQSTNLVGMNQAIWARPATGSAYIVSGVVAFNALVKAPTTGGNSWFTFALHELGHAVGLGHTSNATQIMAPTIPAEATDFGSGDLAGLAKVGGTC